MVISDNYLVHSVLIEPGKVGKVGLGIMTADSSISFGLVVISPCCREALLHPRSDTESSSAKCNGCGETVMLNHSTFSSSSTRDVSTARGRREASIWLGYWLGVDGLSHIEMEFNYGT